MHCFPFPFSGRQGTIAPITYFNKPTRHSMFFNSLSMTFTYSFNTFYITPLKLLINITLQFTSSLSQALFEIYKIAKTIQRISNVHHTPRHNWLQTQMLASEWYHNANNCSAYHSTTYYWVILPITIISFLVHCIFFISKYYIVTK